MLEDAQEETVRSAIHARSKDLEARIQALAGLRDVSNDFARELNLAEDELESLRHATPSCE
jgi:hypothetical protein